MACQPKEFFLQMSCLYRNLQAAKTELAVAEGTLQVDTPSVTLFMQQLTRFQLMECRAFLRRYLSFLSLLFWHCWLDDRKHICLVKTVFFWLPASVRCSITHTCNTNGSP